MARNKQSADVGSPERAWFDDGALADCLACLSAYPAIALAVSGGADSMALMLLVKRWLVAQSDHAPAITILTVDHGLRPEAGDEARWVTALASRLGFDHETLQWSGDKPKTGIQAAARKARYRLMTAYCREHGIPALVTAHHGDDQAETLLMRLRRGSGVDGLASMPPRSARNGIDLLRPLLSFTRDQLRSFLKAEGQSWREDPSNMDESYERIRLRTAMSEAGQLGLSQSGLSLSARRLTRARVALERTAAEFLQTHLLLDEAGFGTISLARLLDEAEEIGLRALIRMAAAFGGRNAVRLMRAESAYAKLRDGAPGMTLAGCHFSVRKRMLTAAREYGRMSRTPVLVEDNMLWDGRFTISIETSGNPPDMLTLRPLGTDGIRLARAAGLEFEDIPRAALLSMPSFWRDEHPCHVPFALTGDKAAHLSTFRPAATFANREYLFNVLISGNLPLN